MKIYKSKLRYPFIMMIRQFVQSKLKYYSDLQHCNCIANDKEWWSLRTATQKLCNADSGW